MRGLNGARVLVCGAARGIGAGIAERLVQEGSRVFLADRDEEALAASVASIGAPDEVASAPYQQGEPASIERLLSQVWAWGELDGACIVAGIHPGPFSVGQVRADVWDDVHGVNVRGALLLMSGLLPRMYARGRGSLLAVGSVAGIRPEANDSIYASSKAALGAVLKSCSQEAAPFGVRVNALLPGVIDTPLLRSQIDAGQMDEVGRMIPAQRIGQASEVAAAAVFLLSDEASYITGAELVVDGGLAAAVVQIL